MKKISDASIRKIDILTDRLFHFIHELPNRSLADCVEKIWHTSKINEIRTELNLQPVNYPEKQRTKEAIEINGREVILYFDTSEKKYLVSRELMEEILLKMEGGK